MSKEEQKEILLIAYKEAMRYISNAKEILKDKAIKKEMYYQDDKYVKMACGTAYSGVLIALDALLKVKNITLPSKRRRSIEFYRDNVAKMDKKILNHLNTAYIILHLEGYYEGVKSYKSIQDGLEKAKILIDYIKP